MTQRKKARIVNRLVHIRARRTGCHSRNLDDLVVHRLEQIAERLNASLRDKVPDLSRLLKTSRGGVGEGPAGLFLSLEVGGLEDVDKRRNDVGINDGLDLVRTVRRGEKRCEV